MRLKQRDWPFTIMLVVLTVLTVVFAMLDRSCELRRSEIPGEHAIRIK